MFERLRQIHCFSLLFYFDSFSYLRGSVMVQYIQLNAIIGNNLRIFILNALIQVTVLGNGLKVFV